MATALPLEGDGLIDNLFHFLWSKDDFGSGPRIYVPHTVLFKAAQPSAWYFTSLKSGKIKKKNKVNLTNLQIEHEFTRRSRQLHGSSGENTDIVACYLYQLPGGCSDGHELATATVIEYFDATALHEFLFSREKPHNGMLQRFILPKGTHNATIRAIWSPKICLLERRVNNKSLYDPHFSVYERGVTFDGGGAGELFTKPEPVRGAMLPGEVQSLCEQVVDHVTQVSYHKYRISRMVLHLKADADDRLWLLWCSSLRLLHVGGSGGDGTADASSMRPLDIVSEAHVPAHISLGRVSHAALSPSLSPKSHHHSNSSKSRSKHHRPYPDEDDPDTPLRDGFQRCTSCACVVEQFRMLSTTYKAVLQHFQKFLLFLRLKVNEQEQVAIAWPPDQQLIQAAGGVGFGILRFCERSVSPSKQQHSNPATAGKPHVAGLNAQELIIPPVIQYLHPTLGVDDFERHRQDPIFLHKPVAVCESCCLVYSDYATSALEINSLRPTVPAILRPQREVNDLKRRLDPIDPISMAATSPGRKPQAGEVTTGKPPASAWKPIPRNVEKAAKLIRGGGFGLTKSTLHLLPPAPTLPDRIESLAAFIGSLPSSNEGGNTSSPSAQQREETFFRELYHQQVADAGEGHPLHHMLESSGQLAQLSSVKNKQLRAIRKGATDASRGSAFGSQSTSSSLVDWQSAGLGMSASMSALDRVLNKKPVRNPYTVVQKLTMPHDHQSASTLQHQRRQQKKNRPCRAAPSWEQEEDEEGDEDRESGELSGSQSSLSPSNKHRTKRNNTKSNNSRNSSPPRRRYVSSRETQASNAHQEFLFAALSDAQQQLEHLESLASIVLDDDPPSSSSSSPVSFQKDTTSSETFGPSGVLLDAVAPATVDELQSVMSENASLYENNDDDNREDGEIHHVHERIE